MFVNGKMCDLDYRYYYNLFLKHYKCGGPCMVPKCLQNMVECFLYTENVKENWWVHSVI